MPTTALELQTRTSNFMRALEACATTVGGDARGRKLVGSMMKSCLEMDTGYRHACASSSRDEFISRIAHVARNAKKTRMTLQTLTQLDYLPIAETRNLILEAKGLENVFVASRNTAKRRRPFREAMPAARPPRSRKTARRR